MQEFGCKIVWQYFLEWAFDIKDEYFLFPSVAPNYLRLLWLSIEILLGDEYNC